VDHDRKKIIEGIFEQYHRPCYLGLDPLEFVHRFVGRRNREIGGLICSVLAYGRVEQIRKSIAAVLNITGLDLNRFCGEVSYPDKKKVFRGFVHRFNDGVDIAVLLECVRRVLSRYGSIEEFFADGIDESDKTIKRALDGFVSRITETACGITVTRRPSFSFFFPSPCNGSACKRLNMYLRWMVRKNDGIDLGIWKSVHAARLVMPVDTHVAGAARRLGLTQRKTADWVMAEEITDALRHIDPNDPVRFDFSLCRAGMVGFRTLRNAA
jgi:uncharacterized protein (TIGR02757 family)